MFKKFLRSERGQNLVTGLAAAYMRFVFRTTRWTVHGAGPVDALVAAGDPFIVCFWHQRLFQIAPLWARRTPFHMMISSHRDGRMISKTVAHFGIDTIPGSSTRGGASALRGMVDTLRGRNLVVGITPDGPRGPARKAAPGTAAIAMMAKVPVALVAYSTRGRFVGSWDRMLLPYPFGRGVALWDVLAEPPRGKADLAAFSETIERRLDALCDEADRLAGMGAR